MNETANSEKINEGDVGSPENFPKKTIVDEAREEREKIEKASQGLKELNEKAEKLALQIQMAEESRPTQTKEQTPQEIYEEESKQKYK